MFPWLQYVGHRTRSKITGLLIIVDNVLWLTAGSDGTRARTKEPAGVTFRTEAETVLLRPKTFSQLLHDKMFLWKTSVLTACPRL